MEHLVLLPWPVNYLRNYQGYHPMHEYTIAYDIYATARKAALEHQATQVKRVMVDVGEMAMVNPEQIDFLFHVIADEDPLFRGVVLETKTVKPRVACSCGYEGETLFICPVCGALPEIVRGKEILVTNIEAEVD